MFFVLKATIPIEEDEFLADFISYNVAQELNPAIAITREYVRYEKINDGDTVHLFDLSALIVTGPESAHIINTGTNFTFPNKDVVIIVTVTRFSAGAATGTIRTSVDADTANGDLHETMSQWLQNEELTFRITGNFNGKFMTFDETGTGSMRVTQLIVIERA